MAQPSGALYRRSLNLSSEFLFRSGLSVRVFSSWRHAPAVLFEIVNSDFWLHGRVAIFSVRLSHRPIFGAWKIKRLATYLQKNVA
jgi:hypothetical protein